MFGIILKHPEFFVSHKGIKYGLMRIYFISAFALKYTALIQTKKMCTYAKSGRMKSGKILSMKIKLDGVVVRSMNKIERHRNNP